MWKPACRQAGVENGVSLDADDGTQIFMMVMVVHDLFHY